MKNVNEKLIGQFVEIEKHCWDNDQYSKRYLEETVEISNWKLLSLSYFKKTWS